MPRKRVNGNIIGTRWQDIRHRGEIIAVNRRTGGLEKQPVGIVYDGVVNRRIGGLENFKHPCFCISKVNRRTGGLEN